jgi:hypothetical protein
VVSVPAHEELSQQLVKRARRNENACDTARDVARVVPDVSVLGRC